MKKISEKAKKQYISLRVKVKDIYQAQGNTLNVIELANTFLCESESTNLIKDIMSLNDNQIRNNNFYYKLNKDKMTYGEYKKHELNEVTCMTIKYYLEDRLNTLATI